MPTNSTTPDPEFIACTPIPLVADGFNPKSDLPEGLTIEHLRAAMEEFIAFVGFINAQLHTKEIERLETMLMPANFSSIVGEFMNSTIPKHSLGLVKNKYPNGHPDLLPANTFPGDAVRHAGGGDNVGKGIEIKGSRYMRGWQGHNEEDVWIMVFVFDSNRPSDPDKSDTYVKEEPERRRKFEEKEADRKRKFEEKEAARRDEYAAKVAARTSSRLLKEFQPKQFTAKEFQDKPNIYLPRPFRFIKVVGAATVKADWRFSGRGAGSSRTPTAAILTSGYEKMEKNWIYKDVAALDLGLDRDEPLTEADVAVEISEEAGLKLFEDADFG